MRGCLRISFVHVMLAGAATGGCSQGSQPPGASPGTPPGTVAYAPAAAAAGEPGGPAAQAAQATQAAPQAGSAPAPEPFHDAAKNFEAARKAMLEGYYRASLTEEDMYRAAVAGMLEGADPAMHRWNKLLTPTELSQLRADLSGELVGIGAVIDLDPATGYIDVKGVIPGTPADHAGVAPPDKIVTIDGKLYKGLTLRDAIADIRGKAGETVTLSILRGAQLVSVPVVREKIAYDTVQGSMVATDVGLVRIPAFNERTAPALHDALSAIAGRHPRALVVDLRDNPGGSFDAAVDAAAEMVPAGSTVVTVAKRDRVEPFVAKGAPVLPDVPIAVVVDHATASSAELLTAALRDLRHATVVGSTTQGKWTVQRLDDLPNGYAIKYTMGVFSSPSGKSYEGVGLKPDVEVDMSDDAIARARALTDPARRLADDTQLRTAVTMLR
jgi:carboxyl-terminal processing protease